MTDEQNPAGAGRDTEALLGWLDDLHAPHDVGLSRAFDAPEADGLPLSQVSPREGRSIGLLLQMVGARQVIEIGTLAGYSAIWIARAMGAGGRLWTIEADPAHADVAERNVKDAGVAEQVVVCRGAATEVLRTLEPHGPFDAVFVDADKENYHLYGAWAARHVRPGGLLLGDNANFFGRLLEDSEGAASMRQFHVDAKQAFETAYLPTPEGLLVGIRRGSSLDQGEGRAQPRQ